MTWFFSLWKRSAGIVCLCGGCSWDDWNLHIIVQRSHWQWGIGFDGHYDGAPIWYVGLGPFFLLTGIGSGYTRLPFFPSEESIESC